MNIVPDLPLVLIQIAPPLVLMLGLQLILFKPMLAYLAERKHVTVGVRAEADAVNGRADVLARDWEAAMDRTRTEIVEARAARRATANAHCAEIVSAARRESEARVNAALAEIRRETALARGQVQPQATVLAGLMTQHLLGHGPQAEA